jgi:hypothetical protein
MPDLDIDSSPFGQLLVCGSGKAGCGANGKSDGGFAHIRSRFKRPKSEHDLRKLPRAGRRTEAGFGHQVAQALSLSGSFGSIAAIYGRLHLADEPAVITGRCW